MSIVVHTRHPVLFPHWSSKWIATEIVLEWVVQQWKESFATGTNSKTSLSKVEQANETLQQTICYPFQSDHYKVASSTRCQK
jgi:hypothetical protein